MALQFSTTVRNARLDAFETSIGVSAVLEIRTGAMPANVAASRTGSILDTTTLPSDWMAAASGGTKAKLGTWSSSASGAGTAGYFTLYASDGTTAHAQGTVTLTGSGGDLTVDNPVFANAQAYSVTAFTLTEGNA